MSRPLLTRAVIALVAGVVPATLAVAPASAALHFGRCPDSTGVDHTTACAHLRVPLDYAQPHGRRITLTVASKAASGTPAQRQGLLFVNPGGPGEPALPLASATWNSLPPDLQDAYQVVAVDPRGVGQSTPLGCGLERLYRPPLPDFRPASKRSERRQVARAKATARACGRHSHSWLAHLDTADTARDMDAVRAAFGEQQLSYLGYSYGTYLGEVYGELFPSRVRRLILDSIIDPAQTNSSAFEQDRAFQARVGDFFAWTARRHRAYGLGSSTRRVAAEWGVLRRRLAHRPAGRSVGPSELDGATSEAMYSTSSWPDLAHALAMYRRGHPDDLVAAGRVLSGASGAASLAVSCRDKPWPAAWSRWHADTVRIFRVAPLTAWESTWASAPCAFWPVPGGPNVRVTGNGLPPVLLMQSARDPATPLAGARRARALYGSRARMVLQGGGNHGQYLAAGDACMNRFGNAYLRTGSLPARDARCHRARGRAARALAARIR